MPVCQHERLMEIYLITNWRGRLSVCAQCSRALRLTNGTVQFQRENSEVARLTLQHHTVYKGRLRETHMSINIDTDLVKHVGAGPSSYADITIQVHIRLSTICCIQPGHSFGKPYFALLLTSQEIWFQHTCCLLVSLYHKFSINLIWRELNQDYGLIRP